jgi:hypothetical protein
MSTLYPFGIGSLQKRLGPATRGRRKPWNGGQPPIPESLIHCERALQRLPGILSRAMLYSGPAWVHFPANDSDWV